MSEWKKQLAELLPNFFGVHAQVSKLKKQDAELNTNIKNLMKEYKLPEFVADGYKATYSTSSRDSFVEDRLIATLKKHKLGKGLIKKREYVDMDALEDALYKGKLKAALIADCVENQEVVTLKVRKLKDGEF